MIINHWVVLKKFIVESFLSAENTISGRHCIAVAFGVCGSRAQPLLQGRSSGAHVLPQTGETPSPSVCIAPYSNSNREITPLYSLE